jgi:hypothetical protein
LFSSSQTSYSSSPSCFILIFFSLLRLLLLFNSCLSYLPLILLLIFSFFSVSSFSFALSYLPFSFVTCLPPRIILLDFALFLRFILQPIIYFCSSYLFLFTVLFFYNFISLFLFPRNRDSIPSRDKKLFSSSQRPSRLLVLLGLQLLSGVLSPGIKQP